MNNQLLQRLVDGELSSDERANVIRRLDQHPDDWRRVALEFLHQQLLNQAIGDDVADHLSASQQTSQQIGAIESKSILPRRLKHYWVNPIATVAILLLMVSLGYSLAQLANRSTAEDSSVAVQVDAESKLSLADALAKCVTPVPDSFRREMLTAGYFLVEDQQLTEVKLPTGDTIEMPIRQFDIHYIGEAAFQ